MASPRTPRRPALTRRPGIDPCPTIAWIGWHLGEITAVTVPGVLAVTISGWWALLSLTIAAAWIAHELRLERRRAALATTTLPRPVTTGAPTPTDTDTGDGDGAPGGPSVVNGGTR